MFGELDVEIRQTEVLKAMKEIVTSRSGGPNKLLKVSFYKWVN